VGKKQRRVKPTDPADLGDQYVFIGIDATRKAIISYRVGKRDGDNANAFLADLRNRVVNRPEISSDGFRPYLEAVERPFGADCS
jgi:transposase-like protein